MYTVFLRSEELGYEEFDYDTLAEALAAIERLHDSALVAALDDGIDREVGIKVTQGATVEE